MTRSLKTNIKMTLEGRRKAHSQRDKAPARACSILGELSSGLRRTACTKKKTASLKIENLTCPSPISQLQISTLGGDSWLFGRLVLLLLGSGLLYSFSAFASDFQQPTPDELKMTSDPAAPAVYLFSEEKADGTRRDAFEVSVPAGFVVDELPDPVKIDVGFATYNSEVKSDQNVLRYSRELVVKELVLRPDQYDALKKLEAAITTDENRSAVLKKP